MAGEASGDIYGAALAEDLRKIGSAVGEEVEIGGMGGPAMAKANVKRTVDSTELGVVGFVEILKHIFTFIGIFRKLVRTVKAERPDAVILIDYPTFNMLFGKVVKKLGIFLSASPISPMLPVAMTLRSSLKVSSLKQRTTTR
ncbi:MAG: hypothetical protein IJ939_01290 [Clostridia bacterium]|nr:hypothetical protein [Clostridia bacterium]